MSMPNGSVQPLPDHPNLEMQQKRGKDLLRAAWAGDAAALAQIRSLHPSPPEPDAMKLADAQLVVARGYGFRDWTALKRKIESLTKPPLEQLIVAVHRGDVDWARELLTTYPDLSPRINDPIGDFGAPLIHAAKRNLPMVDLLLMHGANINQKSNWWAGGFGILEWACPPEVAAALIERGAIVDVWAAAHLGAVDRLRELLDADPSLVHARGGDGKTPLHCAATIEIVRLLLDRGAQLEMQDVDHESTPLQYLIDKPEMARLLIDYGAEVDIFAAAALGDVALIKCCIERDPRCVEHRLGTPPWVTVNSKGGKIYNWSLGHDLAAVDVARIKGHDDAYQLLLDHSPPKTRFMQAIWRGDGDEARALLRSHPSVMHDRTDDDKQMLARAAWWYQPAAVKLMLELGFDPHVPGVHRSTPLDRAVFHGYADIAEMLLRHDPDPPMTFTNEFGGTPLDACIYGWQHGWKTGNPQAHARTVELLLNAGATFDPTWLPTGNDEIDAALREILRRRRT